MRRRGTLFRRCGRCRRVVKGRRCPCGGNDSWAFAVDVSADGEQRQQAFRSGFATKGEANEAMAKLLADKAKGTYVEPSKLTVGQYLDDWLAGAKLRATTRRSYRGAVKKLQPLIGTVRLQQLDRRRVKEAYRTLAATPRAVRPPDGANPGTQGGDMAHEAPKLPAPKTIHNVHLALSAALAAAVADRLIPTNPAHGAHKFNRDDDQNEMRYWNAKELETFLGAVRDHHLFALFRLAAFTGMRRGELLGLRWEDVQLPSERLSVRQQVTRIEARDEYVWGFGPPKTKKGRRTIDLDPGTVATLREHKRRQAEWRLAMGDAYDGDLVFAREDGRYLDPDVVSETFDKLVSKTKVPTIRFHDLRHTHATILLKIGKPVKVVSERLGHARVSTTQDVYQHVIPGMQQEAALAFAAAVAG